MKYIFKNLFANLLLYMFMCGATFLMLRTLIGYTSFDTRHGFLAQKQDYLNNKIWLFAFYLHVFTSLFTLIAGFTQFSKYILTDHRKLHRLMGKLYVAAVLFINVPAGFIMAIYANGLLPGKTAFLILDLLWFFFTYKGWKTAMNKDFGYHRRWMKRSYALTLSAITLRTWRMILQPIVPDPLTLYIIDAWLGFVPNLLLAEWMIWMQRKKEKLPMKIQHKNI